MQKKIFVISDLLLFNEDRKIQLGFDSFQDMNDFVVRRWNASVNVQDVVIVMGVVCERGARASDVREVISKLNGMLVMIAYEQNDFFPKEEWQSIGFKHVWNTNMCSGMAGIVYCGQKLTSPQQFDIYHLVMVDNSTPMQDNVVGNRMRGDALIWDYTPLNTEHITEVYEELKKYYNLDFEDVETRTDVEE